MGNQSQHRREDMGLVIHGGGITRTIQIDQQSFNNMATKDMSG